MVTVTIENNEFKFHGTFDCGYAGLYRDDQIFFYGEPDDFRYRGLPGKDLSKCSDEELAAEMAAFYNATEAHLQQNIQEFNGKFIDQLMDDFQGCGWEYWTYPNMVSPAFLQAHPDFDDWYHHDIDALPEPAFIPENAGRTEIAVRRDYPGFDFEYYLSHLTLHSLHVMNMKDGGWISFCISDAMDYLCQLIGEVKPDFTFNDWNNG